MTKLLFIIIFLFSSNCYAAQAFDLIKGDRVDAKSRTYRVELADDLLQRFTTLNKAVPALTEEQTNYLKTQREKISKLTDPKQKTRETAIMEVSAAKSLTDITAALNSITKVLSCVKNIPAAEMTCWALASYYLMNPDVFTKLQKLSKTGLIKIPANTIPQTDVLGYGYFPNLFGQGILKYIITPYIAKVENVNLVIQD